ncbi:MAG: hypothetical protein QXU32_06635 [Nitrososphaerales archaeon]
MSFLVKIDVQKNIPQLDAQTHIALEAGVNEIADHAFVTLLSNTPLKSGLLRSSYQKLVSGLSARISSVASYVMAVESGSRPHVIATKNARALHFIINGRDVFAKRVQHPGSRGRFFIARTAETVKRDSPSILARHLQRVGKK